MLLDVVFKGTHSKAFSIPGSLKSCGWSGVHRTLLLRRIVILLGTINFSNGIDHSLRQTSTLFAGFWHKELSLSAR